MNKEEIKSLISKYESRFTEKLLKYMAISMIIQKLNILMLKQKFASPV